MNQPDKIQRRGSESILLVEDEAPTRQMTAMVLKRLGYRVQEASNAEEALRVAEDPREKIDLLMTDVVMKISAVASWLKFFNRVMRV